MRIRPPAPTILKLLFKAAQTLPTRQKMILQKRAFVVKTNMTFQKNGKLIMKRIGNLYSSIYTTDNLLLADKNASKGKKHQAGVKSHLLNREDNINQLQQIFINKAYNTSLYKTFTLREPKEREIYCLPYFPDRIAHHAIMNIIKPVFNSVFTADSYASIEGKGTHAASYALRKALNDVPGTIYCLKLDIKKFYPSINHDILKSLLRKKFKDADLLPLLNGIIDSADGVPIGNYLSQYFANFYLTGFDHWLKEQKKVPYYFRYKDDMVLLSDSKEKLHQLLADIKAYLNSNLKLIVKSNYQIFPVAARGIDFVGYVHFHTHILLRKTIKKAFARKIAKGAGWQTVAAYKGWANHCNSTKLLTKLLYVQIQRPKNSSARINRICRRQNKNRKDFKQGNHYSQMGNKAIRIHQRMPIPTDRNKGSKIHSVDGEQVFNTNHQAGTGKQISINYNN